MRSTANPPIFRPERKNKPEGFIPTDFLPPCRKRQGGFLVQHFTADKPDRPNRPHRQRKTGDLVPKHACIARPAYKSSYERPFVKCLIAKKRFFLVNFRLGDLKKCFLSCSYSRSYKVQPRTPHDKCPSGASIYWTSFLFIWRMITPRTYFEVTRTGQISKK